MRNIKSSGSMDVGDNAFSLENCYRLIVKTLFCEFRIKGGKQFIEGEEKKKKTINKKNRLMKIGGLKIPVPGRCITYFESHTFTPA